MLDLATYANADMIELARLVAAKDVTPLELLETTLRAVQHTEPQIHAITGELYDRARRQIARGLPQGPLYGVPFFLKDQIEINGEVSRFGSGLLRDNRAKFTHPVAEKLERSGLVFAAQTNLSEVGFLPFSEPLAYGATHNPWNLEYSAGGSSGGSAAAVAARMVPAAHGMDGGGSIRVPASCCGLFGMKPSRGRNPASHIDDVDGFTAHHVVTQSVRDSALILDITHGPTPHSRNTLAAPATTFLESAQRDPKRLRVAFSTRGMNGNRVAAPCADAIDKTAKLLVDLGHIVVDVRPDIDTERFARAFKVLWSMGAGYLLKMVAQELTGMHVPARLARRLTQPKTLARLSALSARLGMPLLEPFTLRLAALDAEHRPSDLWLAWNEMREASAKFIDLFSSYDVFMSSTLGELPRKLGSFNQKASLDDIETDLFSYLSYCPIANSSGFPAMSVPLQQSQDGLPIGIQFISDVGTEETLFSLAGQLERASPWRGRLPRVHA